VGKLTTNLKIKETKNETNSKEIEPIQSCKNSKEELIALARKK
jgi:hypothetical protein